MCKTLRLNFPQWQGGESGNISRLVPELAPQQAIQGYAAGARLLAFLSPKHQGAERDVPVSLDWHTPTEHGIFAYQANKRQLQAALEMIKAEQPERIVTLGGDCAVSIAPFAYLADKYRDDTAVIWLDAHSDLGLPGDNYTGFHAMALTQLAGFGDEEITAMLPEHKIKTENALIVGLRDFGEPAEQRRQAWGIETVSCRQANRGSDEVLAWLRQRGKSKVLIHLDLDVLDPAELKTAVGTDPYGMSIDAVIRTVADIGKHADIVGFTVAEPMPREVIKLQTLLQGLPL
ncbi:arginase family protein [Pasteurella testudinis]|uniref:arginase family protein n=1 Tax=Pasteurella testudinis TaxID=761 RepID=UPI004057D475